MTATESTTAFCGAKNRKGNPCTRPAGWGTGHSGVGRCKLHGGASPNAEMGGVVELARRKGLVMGIPLDIQPHEALLECIRIAAGEVRYASERIAELDPDDATGPIVTTRPLKMEKGAESTETRVEEHGPPALHIWIEVRHRAMDRLADYSRIALAAGIAERHVRIAEQQGELLAQVIRGVLADLGIEDRPEVSGVVRRHLTLAAAS